MISKESKIFAAGHRGLVGSAIVRKLQAEGFDNIVVRTRKELDLTNQAAVADFFAEERPEYVFLAAAKVGGIWANSNYPAEFIYENIAIQTNIIHQSRLSGVKRLLFLGSSCIYPKYCPQPMREEHLLTGELEPTNEPYAIAKIAGIKMCQAYNKQYGTKYLAVMPTNLYGPNDNYDLMNSHVLPALIRKFHLAGLAERSLWEEIEADERRYGKIPEDIKTYLGIGQAKTRERASPKVVLWGTGSPRREFLHVDDLADACLFLMRLPGQRFDELLQCKPPKASPIINIGSGKDQTIAELAELAKKVVGYKGEISWDASMPDGTERKLLDVSLAENIGWTHRIGMEEGLRREYENYLTF